jgi:hypothetical protein
MDPRIQIRIRIYPKMSCIRNTAYLSFLSKSGILICIFYASPACLFVFSMQVRHFICLSCAFPAFFFIFPVDFRRSSSSLSNCGFLCPSGTVRLSFSFLIMYGVLVYPMRVQCPSFFCVSQACATFTFCPLHARASYKYFAFSACLLILILMVFCPPVFVS